MVDVLLLALLLPALCVPLVYLAGRKSVKAAATIVALIMLVDIVLVLTTVPTILASADHKYLESFYWIPFLNSSFTLFVDGISVSIAIVTLILILTADLFSIGYMQGKKSLPAYYALLTMLSAGLLGVFITSNLLLFYFFWEVMLVPVYFIIGSWGYRNSYKTAFKFFIYTHAGAVFIILGIGAIFMLTGSLDMFQAGQLLLLANSDLVKWVLIALTVGFAVKMAIVPLHTWLPDAYAEAPAPMSAILSGVLTSAGAYAIIRISLGTVLPALMQTSFQVSYLHVLTLLGVASAFFGSFLALRETDMKKVIAYSSISHMGYVLFGASMFPLSIAITGAVLHIITHALSKSLFFLSAGAITKQLPSRDISGMGGLAEKMPFTAVTSVTAALSLSGTPPFACFISEVLIFIGAFQMIALDSFFIVPTALMLVATLLSLAYALRFMSKVFMGKPKQTHKIAGLSVFMKLSMAILAILVVVVGIYPTLFIDLINTVSFI